MEEVKIKLCFKSRWELFWLKHKTMTGYNFNKILYGRKKALKNWFRDLFEVFFPKKSDVMRYQIW